MTKLRTTLLASVLAIAAIAPVSAATDGVLGATSTGTATISTNLVAGIDPEIQIKLMDDLSISADIEVGKGSVYSTNLGRACVQASTGTFGFSLDVSAPHLVGEASGQNMPYNLILSTQFLFMQDMPETAYSSGASVHTITGLTPGTDVDCGDDGMELRYHLRVDPKVAGFPTAPDTYSTTLIFTVTPE